MAISALVLRVLRRYRFWFLALFLILGFLAWAHRALDLRLSDDMLVARLSNNPQEFVAKVSYLETEDRRLRYVEIGDPGKPLIFFVHGAPSSSSFWKNLLRDSTLLANAKLAAVDRPGYGFSGYGDPLPSVRKQAALIAQVIRRFRDTHDKIILHGSSYGGTVVARIAMDFPDLVDGILLQSSSVKPGAERTYWISYPTSHQLLKWLMPGSIQTANAEKLSHEGQLQRMLDNWTCIQAAAIILHGKADQLIYPDNGTFAFRQMVNARYREIRMLEERKHDLLWTKTGLLKESLLKLLDI